MNEGDCWGTLEELLLVCAVTRHGTENWDSVSSELRRCTSDHRHTPPNCRRRYADIRRRLAGDDVVAELRKLRVEELRREVEKHDVSIEFLELKVKRLEGTDLSSEPEIKKPVGGLSDGLVSGDSSNSTTNIKDVIKLVELGDEAAKKIVIKSQPLIKILAIIRAHENGSVFERRLKSQESERYAKIIKQHVDLQMIQRRLDKGFYLHSQRKFFRDLLLLFTNALIFFSKTSNEYSAASELRNLATTQMVKTIPKLDPLKKQIDPICAKLKRAPSPPPPIVVCRRRSSTGSKPGSNSVAVAKSTKEVEVKVKMKNPKFEVKPKERLIVKKPENNAKGGNKKTPPVKELESSSSDETDEGDEEMGRCRNMKDVSTNGKRRGSGRDRRREAESSILVGKRGRPGKGPPPVAARGRGGKRGKEIGWLAAVAEDTGQTRKRTRR